MDNSQLVAENAQKVWARLPAVIDAINAFRATEWARMYPNLTPPFITTTSGEKRVKLISNDGVGSARSVYCFISLMNGDVLKAASWAAPAKHARSNIFDADFGLSGLDRHGARYL